MPVGFARMASIATRQRPAGLSPSGQDFVSWTVSIQNPMTDTTRGVGVLLLVANQWLLHDPSVFSCRHSGYSRATVSYHWRIIVQDVAAGAGNHGITIGHESHDPTPKVKKGSLSI